MKKSDLIRVGGAVLGLLLVLGSKQGIKWASTEFQIRAAIKEHKDWGKSGPELEKKFCASLDTSIVYLNDSPELKKALVLCLVKESIAALNKSGCAYSFNPMTTKMDFHLKEQDACLNKQGYPKTEEKITVDCINRTLPNTWDMATKYFTRQNIAALGEKTKDNEGKAQEVSACVAERTVSILNKSECKPLQPYVAGVEAKDCSSSILTDKVAETMWLECIDFYDEKHRSH